VSKSRKKLNYNYVFVMYDIGETRVHKIFKVCKRYLKHHQNSVFRGHITPAELMRLTHELNEIIDERYDFISIIKLLNEGSFDEETLGYDAKPSESLFL